MSEQLMTSTLPEYGEDAALDVSYLAATGLVRFLSDKSAETVPPDVAAYETGDFFVDNWERSVGRGNNG